MADQMSVNAQFMKIHTHPSIRNDDSTSIVKFANVVTNLVNTLTRLGYTSDPEAEVGLSSSTRKLSPQLREQWLQYMSEHTKKRLKSTRKSEILSKGGLNLTKWITSDTNPRGRQINKSRENFRSRITVIFIPWTELDYRHR